MRALLALSVLAVLLVAPLGGPLIGTAQSGTRVVGERPECVHADAIARFGAMAFDHWVHLENTCGRPVTCTVFTDVNPVPVEVPLASGATHDVATFHGSPASAFTATVNCPER
jgi:hypothetical protein